MQVEAVERALSQLSSKSDVSPSSTYSAMLPAILMPMHVAVDATPFAVRNKLGATYFLKLYAPEMLRFVDLAAALEASRSAGALGIAPKVVAEALDAGAILFELLPAESWRMASRQDLRSLPTLEAIVQAKRAWHRSPSLTRTRDPFELIRSYLLQLETLGEAAGAPSAFEMLKAWINRAQQAIAASGHDVGPLHGENTISNVMLGPADRVMLVDFDYAANGDPYYDLGAFCIECCSFVDEVEAVVSMHLGRADKRILARVLVYMFVDDFLWGCWALIAQAVSSRSGEIEFYKYAQNRFVRCQYWLSLTDFDQALRDL
jgi:thiamine kinase-like enzyme